MRSKALPPARAQGHIVPFLEAAALFAALCIFARAAALMLAVNRRIHRAYARTRDYNFNIAGLEGVVLNGKCAGVVGTGRIGLKFAQICRGFGLRVLA